MTYAIAQPQLAGTEARAQVSSHLLWLLPIALCLAAAGGWAVARGIVDPIRKIDPETPGTEAPYEELVPLLARIRAQNRLIRQQEETLGQTRRDFAAITENMGESFLLLDKRLNVLSRNVSASYFCPRRRTARRTTSTAAAARRKSSAPPSALSPAAARS